MYTRSLLLSLFFFNDTATTEIYTLSLHDALPISRPEQSIRPQRVPSSPPRGGSSRRSEEHTSELQSLAYLVCRIIRSEEHTSELQSLAYLVCRLLLEKKTKLCIPARKSSGTADHN